MHIFSYAHMSVCINKYAYAYTYLHMGVFRGYLLGRVYIYIYACVCVCMNIYTLTRACLFMWACLGRAWAGVLW